MHRKIHTICFHAYVEGEEVISQQKQRVEEWLPELRKGVGVEGQRETMVNRHRGAAEEEELFLMLCGMLGWF